MAKSFCNRLHYLESEIHNIIQNYITEEPPQGVEKAQKRVSASGSSRRCSSAPASNDVKVLKAAPPPRPTTATNNSGKRKSEIKEKASVNSRQSRIINKPANSDINKNQSKIVQPKKKIIRKSVYSLPSSKVLKKKPSKRHVQTITCFKETTGNISDSACSGDSLEASTCLETLKSEMTKARYILEMKVGEINEEVMKSATKMAEESQRKQDKLEKMSQMFKRLEQALLEKKELCDKLLEHQEVLKVKLKELEEKNRDLHQDKENLMKQVEGQKNNFDKVGEMNLHLCQQKRTIDNLQKEIDKSKSRKPSPFRREKELVDQLEHLKKLEQDHAKEHVALNAAVIRLKEELKNSKLQCENRCQCLKAENNKLKSARDGLLKKLSSLDEETRKTHQMMTDEFNKYYKDFKAQKDALTTEKSELRSLTSELSQISNQQNARVNELISLNQAKENTIKSQEAELKSREDKIQEALSTIEVLKKKYEDLEEHVIKRSLDENKTNVKLAKDVKEAKIAIQSLKESLLLKEKVIQENLNTLQTQRMALQEFKSSADKKDQEIRSLQQKIEKLEDQLAMEICKNQAAMKSLTDTKQINNDLTKIIKELERTRRRQPNPEDMGRLQKLVNTLEQQVSLQQHEWEMQKQLMVKQKKMAENAAKFSTQKLLETSMDLQKNADVHKKVQKLLIDMLQDKDMQLKRVRSQISSLTLECTPNREDTHANLVTENTPKIQICEEFRKTVHKPAKNRLSTFYSPDRFDRSGRKRGWDSDTTQYFTSSVSSLSQGLRRQCDR